MQFSIRISNFAAPILLVAAMLLIVSCKGRTTENMVPDGDTIEVIITTTTDTVQTQPE